MHDVDYIWTLYIGLLTKKKGIGRYTDITRDSDIHIQILAGQPENSVISDIPIYRQPIYRERTVLGRMDKKTHPRSEGAECGSSRFHIIHQPHECSAHAALP